MTGSSGSYEDFAHEYYDEVRHPTSANFRTASDSILRSWLTGNLPQRGAFVDVGGGDSAIAALLHEKRRSLRRLHIVDSSKTMLKHSRRWQRLGAHLVLADAERLPFDAGAVSLLVASLGDPFNFAPFWQEVSRVARPESLVIFTTPSYEWASRFRQQQSEPAHEAEFLIGGQRRVFVPSHVLPEKRQIALMGGCGLRVHAVYHVLMEALPEFVSPKITQALPSRSPFVSGYLARAEAKR